MIKAFLVVDENGGFKSASHDEQTAWNKSYWQEPGEVVGDTSHWKAAMRARGWRCVELREVEEEKPA